MAEINIGATLASVTNASARSNFELRFNQLQNTLINRFNDKVDNINSRIGDKFEIDGLRKDQVKLIDSIPILQVYRQANHNNKGQLQALESEIVALQSTINNDNTVTADEVTAFAAQRDVVFQRLNNMHVFIHPDVNDGKVIQKLKDNLDTLETLTATAGSLDPDNAAVTSFLDTLKSKTTSAITTTANTISTVLQLEQKVQKEFATNEAKLLDLTAVEQKKRDAEIESLQVDLANTLRAISLSFEVNSNFAEYVAGGLTPTTPPPGSVLNLFT